MRRVERINIVGIEAFEGGLPHKKFVNACLKERLSILNLISSTEMEQIVKIVGGELVDFKLDETTVWTVVIDPLPKFEIFYLLQRGAPEFEDQLLALYSKDTVEIGIPAEDISDFTVLYANALIYAAKKIRPDLPRISRYL